jgi:hypothetical protein
LPLKNDDLEADAVALLETVREVGSMVDDPDLESTPSCLGEFEGEGDALESGEEFALIPGRVDDHLNNALGQEKDGLSLRLDQSNALRGTPPQFGSLIATADQNCCNQDYIPQQIRVLGERILEQ